MITVDAPIHRKKNGNIKYCHMTASSILELHEFASQCGIKKC